MRRRPLRQVRLRPTSRDLDNQIVCEAVALYPRTALERLCMQYGANETQAIKAIGRALRRGYIRSDPRDPDVLLLDLRGRELLKGFV